MEERNPARYAASLLLKELIKHPEEEIFLSDITSYVFFNEEDEMFTTNEQILKELENLLSEDYSYEAITTPRVFESEIEDFTYEDIIVKLKKNA